MPGRWLTPDSIPAATRCRVLLIPDDTNIYAAVSGALLPLIYEHSWQPFGAVTPAAVSAAMESMYAAFLNSECAVTAEVDIFRHQELQGVDGGGITANTNTRAIFNSADSGNAGNVTLAGNIFTLAPGTYLVRMEHYLASDAVASMKCWIGPGADVAPIAMGSNQGQAGGVSLWMVAETIINTSATFNVDMWLRSTDTRAGDALGNAVNVTGQVECYGIATFLRLSDFP